MEELLDYVNRMLMDDKTPRTLKDMLFTVKEEIEIQILCKSNEFKSLKRIKEMLKSTKKVQLGCGKNIIDNYINIDIVPTCDVIWDIRKSLPFEDDSIDTIFSEHVLEHMDYPKSVHTLLSESFRVLKDKGEFIVGVPDIDYPLNDIKNNSNENLMIAREVWYGNRLDVYEDMDSALSYLNYVLRDQLFHDKYHPHYWGYNEESLTKLLEKYGFDVSRWDLDLSIVNSKRVWGSIYLKGIKNEKKYVRTRQ